MSHFTVLVIGDNFEKQLAPYHEFECTGQDDEYVQEIDKTEEAREGFEKDTERMYRSPAGELVDAYDVQFYRDPTPEETKKIGILAGTGAGHGLAWDSRDWGDGQGYRTKVHFLPEGWEEVRVSSSETQTFAEWCKDYYGWETVEHEEQPDLGKTHKYGYVQLDENGEVVKCIDRTNPNAKWDWYLVGGRWTGFFPLKSGATGEKGEPGLMTDPAKPGTADAVRKGDVDFERARAEAEAKGRERFAKWRPIFEKHGKPELSWSATIQKIDEEIAELEAKGIAEEKVPHPDPDEGRELYRSGLVRHTWRQRYNEQPAIAAARDELSMWGCPVDEYGYDEDTYAQDCRNNALVPYALVKDGKWYGKGEMGWWGMSSDDKDEAEWAEEVSRLYDDLPPDTMLTLVDCHI